MRIRCHRIECLYEHNRYIDNNSNNYKKVKRTTDEIVFLADLYDVEDAFFSFRTHRIILQKGIHYIINDHSPECYMYEKLIHMGNVRYIDA